VVATHHHSSPRRVRRAQHLQPLQPPAPRLPRCRMVRVAGCGLPWPWPWLPTRCCLHSLMAGWALPLLLLSLLLHALAVLCL
jgi:hypothetical protein